LNDAGRGAAQPSLRTRLSRHVLVTLMIAWGVGTAIVLGVAEHYAAQAFDRSLLDDTYDLASHVREEGGQVTLDLTAREMGTLLFDHTETVYYAVRGPGDTFVAGRPDLVAASVPRAGDHQFSALTLDGRSLRTVTLRKTPDILVVMGETTNSREALLRRLLVFAALPQAVLLLFLAWALRRGIDRDLAPLARLHEVIERRDADDLTPLPADVTTGASTREVARIGGAVDSLLARLSTSIAGQREFTGTVAHELRTPLSAVRAHASFALSSGDPAVWSAELAGIAQAEQRASRLVDQLLALARASEHSAGLHLESVALNELVRDVVLRFLPRAHAAGTDLGAEGLDDEVRVRGDRALLEGMLNNLLDNALRYGVAPEPRITVAVACEGDAVRLSVQDNGPGLGSHSAAHLQQRWAQGMEGQRVGQGAGLGLAIVARYAELLGAEFTLESPAAGQGLSAALRFRREGAAPA
jgi:two-component system sensor histidine kinase TctE